LISDCERVPFQCQLRLCAVTGLSVEKPEDVVSKSSASVADKYGVETKSTKTGLQEVESVETSKRKEQKSWAVQSHSASQLRQPTADFAKKLSEVALERINRLNERFGFDTDHVFSPSAGHVRASQHSPEFACSASLPPSPPTQTHSHTCMYVCMYLCM